ncbi:MAG: hypothetical protein SWK76_06845 [Actinomycetota bacterium]|nr:hypothetical protein [Actinomycetota bacterium]
MKETKKVFSSKDIGILGSYSSFLALLLVATILAYRNIFDYMVELFVEGVGISTIEVIFIILIIAAGLAFLVLPSIPIIMSTGRAFKESNHALAWMLIFILGIYIFAVISQFAYTLLEELLK